MSRLLRTPLIIFKCTACGATCEDDAHKFTKLNTMPPMWTNECAFCHSTVTCQPSALIAMDVNKNFGEYMQDYMHKRRA